MKNILLTLFAVILQAGTAFSQWSTDPANPLLVCNLANTQTDAQAFTDGSGGAFVFWRDAREAYNIHKIYGQHYDENGVELWEENGRLVITDEEDIRFFRTYRYDDGKIIIGWYNAEEGVANPNDKLWFQELDNEATKVWENDLAISEEHPTGELSVGSYITCEVIRDDLGFHVMMHIQTYGYNRVRISRFSETGELLMPFDGVEIGPLGLGQVHMTADGANGAYVYYSAGNGAGAALYCNHINEYAEELWANWVNVTTGDGLYYQFSGIGDEEGVTFVWQGNNLNVEELYARRLLPDGNFDWDGESAEICTFEGVQRNFYWEKKNGAYYIVWADGRPGQVGYYGIYGQKFNAAGDILWAEDGIEIADLNTYIPNPKFALDTDLNMYACHQSTVAGYVSQKVADDGTLQWDADGQQIGIIGYNPFYEAHQEFLSGDKVLAVWELSSGMGGTDGIYITQIKAPQVNISETVSACDSYTLNDITYTESGTYVQELEGDTVLTIELNINESEVQTFDVQSCDSYLFDNELLSESGTYEHVYTNANGCDSTVILSLTIEQLNTNVTQNGNTLTAVTSNAYEWINCDGNVSTGVTTQSFTPTETGEYAVIVYSASCADTSDCILVTIVSVSEMPIENSLFLFPNPFEESFVMEIPQTAFTSTGRHLCIQLFDISGRMVFEESIISKRQIIAPPIPTGAYSVRITGGDEVLSGVVVKN